MFRWPWFTKAKPVKAVDHLPWGDAYKVTGAEVIAWNELDASLSRPLSYRTLLELEASYTLQPNLRPAPDPYVWRSPWEGQ